MSTTHALIALAVSASVVPIACAERVSSAPPSSSSTPAAPASSASDESPQALDGPRYDPATVETVRGEVVRVERTQPARGTSGGVHALMRTERGETLPVHLGPAWFIESQDYILQPGDTLEVTGSRVTFDGAPALIARAVVNDRDELVLRDQAGFPAWSGAGRRGARLAPTPTPTAQERSSDMSVLNDAEKQALRDALDDEYRAWATYDQVIRDHGPERPFINIRDAEARHIEALRALFQRYGLEVPENPWPDRAPRYASTREACEASVDAEVENAALYERLMRSTDREDILAVFGNLQRASQENHLPAFRRCADRGAGRGARRQ